MLSRDICLLASRIAKGGTGMVAIAGQMLTLVLEDLKYNRNLKVNRVTQSLVIPPATYGPFALEADYLRTYDLFYPMPASGGGTVSGLTIFLTSITMEQFDAEFKSPSTTNYPYEYATDLSSQVLVAGTTAGNLFVYPQTSGQLTLTHRYMKNQPDIASPEASTVVPWFASNDYLVAATAARMMGVTGDGREGEYMAKADKLLAPYLIMEGDEQQTVKNIRLDPRHFRAQQGLKPVKSYPY
jgi:hypothetical protein